MKDSFVAHLLESWNLRMHGGHKPGILGEFSEPGKLMEFSGNCVQPQGKIITHKIILVRSNICVTQLLTIDWVNRIIMISGSSDLAQ